ncbi:hypothetical protein BgiBS90_007764, partial [Biomphalaria glabrata]
MTFFSYAISSSVNFTSAWVKLHHNFTFTMNLKHLNSDANAYYLEFMRASSKESTSVLEVDLTHLQVGVSERYMPRILTMSYNSMRMVKTTLTDCTHSDAGLYFCFLGRNQVPDCKFRLYILDLDAITSTLGKDIKMTFDFSKISMPKKESISIMYGNMAEVISWREVLVVRKDSIKPSVNPNFGRDIHTIHEQGGSILHVTLTDVMPEDSGFYACFFVQSKEMINYCGFELIILDLKGISVLEDNNAVMFFYLNSMNISKDLNLSIAFKQEEHYTFTDMLSIGPDLSVEVSEAFRSRVTSHKKEDERLVIVTLSHVLLADGGDYRCLQNGQKIPFCGYKLTVHVEESQDSNQVNTLENRDAEMVFRISQLVENTSKVIIEFQHSSTENTQRVLTINVSDIKKSYVETKYYRRVTYRFEPITRAVTVRLKKVTLADDGVYKCYVEATLDCVQKLNVFAPRIKHVVHKPWNIHEGESFQVTCDKSRFRYPADVINVIDMSLRKQSIGQPTFNIIASYKPNAKMELTFHGPTNRTWIPSYSGGSDPNTISLVLNITGVITEDAGEYECDSFASTKDRGRIHYSLISWVTVKPKRATEAPQQATNAPEKPEENTDDLTEIYSYVKEDVTLTFHMKFIESEAPVVIIKFRRQGTDAWKNILEITKQGLLLKRLTIDTQTFFSSNDNDSTVDLSLREVTMERAGLYRCFTEGLITSIVHNCGYRLLVH